MKGRIVIDPPKSPPPPHPAAQSVSAASMFPMPCRVALALSPTPPPSCRAAIARVAASRRAAVARVAASRRAALARVAVSPSLPLYRLCLHRREAPSFHGPLLHSSALVRIIRTETEKLMMSVACPCDSFVCTSLKFESFALINSPPIIFL